MIGVFLNSLNPHSSVQRKAFLIGGILYKPCEEGAGAAASHWVALATMHYKDPVLEKLYLCRSQAFMKLWVLQKPADEYTGTRSQKPFLLQYLCSTLY